MYLTMLSTSVFDITEANQELMLWMAELIWGKERLDENRQESVWELVRVVRTAR